MPQFTTDKDLLRHAPRVFIDAADEATDVLSVSDGDTSGTTLTSATSDFETDGVGAGAVVIVDGVPLEVIARLSPTTLTVSRPRANENDDAIAPGNASAQSVIIRSFARLRDSVEDMTLRLLGIGEIVAGITIEPTMILNTDVLSKYLASRAVAMAYARASAAQPDDAPLAALATQYGREAERSRRSLAVRLDLDGDGEPDATRRLSTITLQPR